jgi:hypothetical protein
MFSMTLPSLRMGIGGLRSDPRQRKYSFVIGEIFPFPVVSHGYVGRLSGSRVVGISDGESLVLRIGDEAIGAR